MKMCGCPRSHSYNEVVSALGAPTMKKSGHVSGCALMGSESMVLREARGRALAKKRPGAVRVYGSEPPAPEFNQIPESNPQKHCLDDKENASAKQRRGAKKLGDAVRGVRCLEESEVAMKRGLASDQTAEQSRCRDQGDGDY